MTILTGEQNSTEWLETQLETGLLFTTLSFGTSVTLAILLYLYYRDNNNNLGTTSNIGILFFASVTTSIADFLLHERALFFVYKLHTLTKMLIFGIILFCLGTKYLFKTPNPESDEQTFGEHHKNVSLIVLLITIPLVVIEIVAAIISQLSEPDVFYLVVNLSAIMQKAVQGGCYHFVLRNKTPLKEKKHAASLFFKILSLLNFSMWLQSILEAEQNFDLPVKKGVLRDAFTVIGSTYFALAIDYRLLCSLLFLEHSYEISHNELHRNKLVEYQMSENEPSTYTNLPDPDEKFYEKSKIFSRYGYAVGVILLIVQFINALEYLPDVGPAVNIIGITGEFAVVVQGFLLIRQARPTSKVNQKWRESNSKGVDLMVAMMGVTGLAFWILKTYFLIIWSARLPTVKSDKPLLVEFQWLVGKFFLRALCCLFHIYIYARADLNMGCQTAVMYNKFNHFLLPSLTFSFLSVFVNSVVDSYHSDIKYFVKKSKMNVVVFAFYEAGIPIHLGFVLHLFIHFLLINNKMKDALKEKEKRYRIEDIFRDTHERRNLIDDGDDENDNDDKVEPLLPPNKAFRTF